MKYYSEYVNHMLRFYVRHRQIKENELEKKIDLKNWNIVKMVLDDLKEKDRNVIIKVYEKQDSIPNNILETSKELGIRQNVIWTLLNKVCRKIAKERELI